MAAIRTPAAKRQTWYLFVTKPTAATVAAFAAATDITCFLAASGTYISAAGSDKITDPAVCEDTNSGAFGTGNYAGQIAPYVLLDSAGGTYDLTDNPAFEAFKQKNTIAYLGLREGVLYGTAPTAGQLVSVYEVRSDTPQRPQELNQYVKRNIPLDVIPLFENAVLTA